MGRDSTGISFQAPTDMATTYTMTLPKAQAGGINKLLWVTNEASNSALDTFDWVSADISDTPKTLVLRDATGGISASNLQIKRFIQIPLIPKVREHSHLVLPTPPKLSSANNRAFWATSTTDVYKDSIWTRQC